MTHNQLKKTADEWGLDLEYVTSWAPPADGDMRPLIAMPNIPRPCHSLAPRTVLGPTAWNKMRKGCYEKANDTCEICGECPEDKRKRHAHECYLIDYEKGTCTFVGVFCICALDHLGAIHTGRALTLWSKGSPLITKEFLLRGAEKAFSTIASYNRERQKDVRLYSTYLEYLKYDELAGPMLELFKKYNPKFYMEDPEKTAKWSDWKLVIDGEEYPTPYKSGKEWRQAMDKKSYNDTFGKTTIRVAPLSDEEVKAEREKLKKF